MPLAAALPALSALGTGVSLAVNLPKLKDAVEEKLGMGAKNEQEPAASPDEQI